jgi:hypothetical protein
MKVGRAERYVVAHPTPTARAVWLLRRPGRLFRGRRAGLPLGFMITEEKCAYRKLFFRDHGMPSQFPQLVAILQATRGLLPFSGHPLIATGGIVRTKNRLEQLETRLRALEEAATPKQPGPGVDDPAIQQLVAQLEQATVVLSDLRGHLAAQADRLSSLSLKLDMTHSRVERIDRIQDEVRQTQEEHTDALTEIRERAE